MEPLEQWLFQQRDAFWSFFSQERPAEDSPHITDIVPSNVSIQYPDRGDLKEQIIDKWHTRPSIGVLLALKRGSECRKAFLAAPDDRGIFIINGQQYYVPFQRLVWNSSPRVEEYRRIDHVLVDGWNRRRPRADKKAAEEDGWVRDSEDMESERSSMQPKSEIRKLCRYLFRILSNTKSGILQKVPEDANTWSILSENVQVRAYNAEPAEKNAGRPEKGKTPYLYVSPMRPARDSKDDVREVQAGLDAFHTPNNDTIGLTRYLCRRAIVSDRRDLVSDGAAPAGLLASCIPFLRYNDPRRVLLACAALAQAQPVVHPERPQVQTDFEAVVRERLPALVDDLGVNLRVGFMFWKGLNYEDAIVVSQSAADKLRINKIRPISVPVRAFAKIEHMKQKGELVLRGEELVKMSFSPLDLDLKFRRPPTTRQKEPFCFPAQGRLTEPNATSPVAGRVALDPELVDLRARVPGNQPDHTGALQHHRARVDFEIEIDRPLQVGDKLSNRHGGKGVVSAIVPDQQMPRVVDGERLEVLLNPIGVFSRGNYGQLLEAVKSDPKNKEAVAGFCLNLADGCGPAPETPAHWELFSEVEIPRQNGPPIRTKAVTGINYILRLPEHAKDKFRVYGQDKPDEMTGQPRRGEGQKYDEMAIWALQAHGAKATLKELCLERSGHKGTAGPQKSLVDHLAAVGLSMTVSNDVITLETADLTKIPKGGTDILSEQARCDKDPYCALMRREEQILKRHEIRRLCSEDFFQEHSPVYIDLGRPVSLPKPFPHKVRYVPVLRPSYRPSFPMVSTKHQLTECYLRLLESLRSSNGQQADATQELSHAVEALFHALAATLNSEYDGKIKGRDENASRRKNGGKKSGNTKGIVREVGLARRLDYSARMVIVPEPSLPIDSVSLPWDAVRVLFKGLLLRSRYGEDIDRRQDEIPFSEYDGLKRRVDGTLEHSWVLLNRSPSLHKYNVLAFRPRVHFDSRVLRIPLLATQPLAGDFDGDDMTVVPLHTRAAQNEAPSLVLTGESNRFSEADGALILKPNKDVLFGLSRIVGDPRDLEDLNSELERGGVPGCLPQLTDLDDAGKVLERYLKKTGLDDQSWATLFEIVVRRALAALTDIPVHSIFGDLESMKELAHAFGVYSGEDMERWEKDNRTWIGGISADSLHEKAGELIGIMISAEVFKGTFGGILRGKCYYHIPFVERDGGGLSFRGQMRSLLVAAQSVTERATQRVLSSKTKRADDRPPKEFKKLFDKCLKTGIDGLSSSEMKAMEVLGFTKRELQKHFGQLSSDLAKQEPAGQSSLLGFLRNPMTGQAGYPLCASLNDPRVRVFVS